LVFSQFPDYPSVVSSEFISAEKNPFVTSFHPFPVWRMYIYGGVNVLPGFFFFINFFSHGLFCFYDR
jgi:hypothetical protein